MRAAFVDEGEHNRVVVNESDLLAAVDAGFEVTGRGQAPWADPHPGSAPLNEDYSRLTDPRKWRIIGARADAWSAVLVDAGLAVVDLEASIRWRVKPGTVVSRTKRVAPGVTGALPLVVARSQLGDVDDAGITLGVGDPALCVAWFPQCGCDACDSGSQDELDRLDLHILGIVSGAFRHLSAGDRTITVIAEGVWSASGSFDRGEVDAILADSTGWDEAVGASWLHRT